ncbi:hypothetical protein [Spirosoma fluviale]|uniref:SGNH/GDSL hydrolase family protein n=1 Tax=Spirosoma fluviale TaxID=1597977 RepID=A0A286FDL2_9BACT|nr:hypothetical protein [Spirosoma fluviale]SOD81292.1 hypothetical protein SAMN06269250_1739 [Spirosoma fluviale]
MLKKILVGFVILLLGWSLLLKFLPADIDTTQNQWNGNLIKAEAYLFERPLLSNSAVILGSSMSARIPIAKTNDSLINLAFGGFSAYDGLELVMTKAQKPTIVYIETNTILNEPSEEFHQAVFSPVRYRLKSVFAALLTKNQPVAVLKGLIRYKKGGRTKVSALPLRDPPPGVNQTILGNSIKQYATCPSDTFITARLTELATFIHALEENSCKVVFFEMPVHPALCQSALSIRVREALYKRFPRERYTYIPQPGCAQFHTTDGIHLTGASAALYADYFQKVPVFHK